jgi:hypothetical protein
MKVDRIALRDEVALKVHTAAVKKTACSCGSKTNRTASGELCDGKGTWTWMRSARMSRHPVIQIKCCAWRDKGAIRWHGTSPTSHGCRPRAAKGGRPVSDNGCQVHGTTCFKSSRWCEHAFIYLQHNRIHGDRIQCARLHQSILASMPCPAMMASAAATAPLPFGKWLAWTPLRPFNVFNL